MTDYHSRHYITLVGTPLAQSFAALMQNAGFKASGINMRYIYTEAGPQHLPEIIGGIRYMPCFTGAAVTKPNKVAVMDLLDEFDPLCKKIGACNTIMKKPGGVLVGFNTDAEGFKRSIIEERVEVEGRSFFCIGAGGVARPICAVLAEMGASRILVTDMYPECARELAEATNEAFAPVVETVAFGDYSRVAECDGVINASGVGMGRSLGVNPLPKEAFRENAFYFDACYNPAKTQFLIDAEAAGGRILNGLGMSLYQGTRQFELWTGAPAPIEAMRAELMSILESTERTN